MSNLPPPPPLSGGPPPPPPPQGQGGYPPSIPVAYVQPAPTGLRTATIVLMWVVVAGYALLAFAAFARKGVWDDFLVNEKSVQDVDDADTFVGASLMLVLAATVATAIVLAIWSHRTTSNAKARGAQVNPGLAAGGWFIPIGWYFVGFSQLRRAVSGRGDTSSLGWWQGLWVVATVGGGVAVQLFDDDSADFEEVSDQLRNQSIGLVVATVLLAVATVFAMRALRAVDDATSGA